MCSIEGRPTQGLRTSSHGAHSVRGRWPARAGVKCQRPGYDAAMARRPRLIPVLLLLLLPTGCGGSRSRPAPTTRPAPPQPVAAEAAAEAAAPAPPPRAPELPPPTPADAPPELLFHVSVSGLDQTLAATSEWADALAPGSSQNLDAYAQRLSDPNQGFALALVDRTRPVFFLSLDVSGKRVLIVGRELGRAITDEWAGQWGYTVRRRDGWIAFGGAEAMRVGSDHALTRLLERSVPPGYAATVRPAHLLQRFHPVARALVQAVFARLAQTQQLTMTPDELLAHGAALEELQLTLEVDARGVALDVSARVADATTLADFTLRQRPATHQHLLELPSVSPLFALSGDFDVSKASAGSKHPGVAALERQAAALWLGPGAVLADTAPYGLLASFAVSDGAAARKLNGRALTLRAKLGATTPDSTEVVRFKPGAFRVGKIAVDEAVVHDRRPLLQRFVDATRPMLQAHAVVGGTALEVTSPDARTTMTTMLGAARHSAPAPVADSVKAAVAASLARHDSLLALGDLQAWAGTPAPGDRAITLGLAFASNQARAHLDLPIEQLRQALPHFMQGLQARRRRHP